MSKRCVALVCLSLCVKIKQPLERGVVSRKIGLRDYPLVIGLRGYPIAHAAILSRAFNFLEIVPLEGLATLLTSAHKHWNHLRSSASWLNVRSV